VRAGVLLGASAARDGNVLAATGRAEAAKAARGPKPGGAPTSSQTTPATNSTIAPHRTRSATLLLIKYEQYQKSRKRQARPRRRSNFQGTRGGVRHVRQPGQRPAASRAAWRSGPGITGPRAGVGRSVGQARSAGACLTRGASTW